MDSLVEMDAMEDIYLEPGTFSKTQESLLDTFTVTLNGANLISLLLVIITQQEDMNHVEKVNLPQHVKSNVAQATKNLTQMINGKLNLFIQFLQMLKRSKQKS